jgi:hypothetical protein
MRSGAARLWNPCRQADVWRSIMDDKTISLWRQIETYRRRNRKLSGIKPQTPAAPRI